MIFGKISPVATIVHQSDPFTPTTVTGSYIAAVARPYVLGTDTVNFQVTYGNAVFDESGSVVNFNAVFNGSTIISGSDITDWGTDDSIILEQIAAQQGTTVIEVVSGSVNVF
jgi:hypothetical protein